ncbi:Gfo/Idh/MocA family protein [Oribacterium sp. FC2011]|uniref:Gfo/Idh/MocA family protein n=1 Tax=Oribacterium sp. FC2011 TaxID=1408311 RepID=UPI0004E1274F|nr:Gfo/Idh/MocA family oxidoreductase [Oribacterium sp. FC2011]
MRLGILGTGMIVKDMLTGIKDLDFDAVYILGTEETREETEELREKYSLDKSFYDYDELLMSDIDTVYVALPNHLHYSFAKKALVAHKNVIVEKPATANLFELMDLKEMSEKEDLILIEASTVNYFPVVLELRKHMDKVGNIHIASINFSQYSSRYDKFMNGEVLPVFDPKKAGGSLMDLNVYNINFMVGLFGKPVFIHYFANVDRGIDTSGILVMDYGTFKASCIAAKDCKSPAHVMLQGDKGYIYSNDTMNKASKFTIVLNDGTTTELEFNNGKHRLFYEFSEFIRMVNEHDTASASKMLAISVTISEIMEEARWKERIIFGNDKLIATGLQGGIE